MADETSTEEKKSNIIKKEAARFSFVLSSKYLSSSDEDKRDIQTALSLFTQAMILSESEELIPEARRHLQVARRIAR